jgi:hypothetical protein
MPSTWEIRKLEVGGGEAARVSGFELLPSDRRLAAPPLHIHRDMDDCWYLLTGTMVVH